MEKTPSGTSVGVDDPYAVVGRCDHVTSEGRCRFAFDHAASDPAFARDRRREDYTCPVVETGPPRSPQSPGETTGPDGNGKRAHGEAERDDGWTWRDCPYYRSRTRGRRCVRCGIAERRTNSPGERPLLEEHHLSYGQSSTNGESGTRPSHEITVSLCRWCHAKVHGSWARIDDDASPDPEAIAASEGRRSREHEELTFETAAKRRDERR